MCNYKVEDGKLVIEHDDRIQWETSSNNEFHKFFKHVCILLYVQALADANHDLNLLPTDGNVVLKRFKTTLQKIFWTGLGNCIEELFVDRNGKLVRKFQNSRMNDNVV